MATTDGEPGPCPACGAPILWAVDPNGRHVPIDLEPSPGGTLSLSQTWEGKPRVTKPSSKLAFGRSNLHTPHRVTCSNLAKLKGFL